MSLSKIQERDLRTTLKRQYENQALTDYVCRQTNTANDLVLIAALCPDYSVNSETGAYSYDSMGSDVPAAYHKARRAISKLTNILEPYNATSRANIKQIFLVCDIENDLPNVVEKFADSEIEVFLKKCRGSRDAIAKLHSEDQNIQVATFLDHLPNFRARFAEALEQRRNDESFQAATSQVAMSRTHMWKKLYGLNTEDAFKEMAARQAINYSLFAQALNEKHGKGKYILVNDKSPNLRFIRGKNTPEAYRVNIVLEM